LLKRLCGGRVNVFALGASSEAQGRSFSDEPFCKVASAKGFQPSALPTGFALRLPLASDKRFSWLRLQLKNE